MYLVEGTQNNCFSDGVRKWIFKSNFGSSIHNPQPWRYAVGVVDGFFYHLVIKDKQFLRYPISILVGNKDRNLTINIITLSVS